MMKDYLYNGLKKAAGLLTLLIILSIIPYGGDRLLLTEGTAEAKISSDTAVSGEKAPVLMNRSHPQVRAVMAIQDRYTHRLMATANVIGTATGLTEEGIPAVIVFTRTPQAAGLIPVELEGIPVMVKVTGEVFAMPGPPAAKGPGKGGDRIDPTSRFDRPVPIGISTGNGNECSSGTIGARVRDASGTVYALSNNHVYARENIGTINLDAILQPGRYDSNCSYYPANVIGTLADFEPIAFTTRTSNTMDAAIARTTAADLGNKTPADGYGMPRSATETAAPGMNVQKYGRTSSLTRGTVDAINATIDIGYSSGTARFVNQVIVYSRKPFIKAGDSGSLLVTDPDRYPVGLLFAGSADGKWAIANPLDPVLERFGVTIDGE